MRKPYILAVAGLLLSVPALKLCSQSAGSVVMFKNGVPSADPVPLEYVYLSFFQYQQHLDQAAAAHEKQGKDGRWLSEHFEHELNFSAAEINIIRMAATSVSEERTDLDSKTKTIVDADRAAWKAGILAVGTPLPNSVAARHLLDRDRHDFLLNQISAMNERLGPKQANVLAVYLRGTFAGSASVVVPTRKASKTNSVAEVPK